MSLGSQGAYDFRLVKDVLAKKDAEIERLRAENQKLQEILVHWNIKSDIALITELADALSTTCDLLKGYGHYVKHGTDLIQRAREATK